MPGRYFKKFITVYLQVNYKYIKKVKTKYSQITKTLH